jgi:hypothetical protein
VKEEAYSTANDSEVLAFQLRVNIVPEVTRLDEHSLLVFRQGKILHVLKRNGDTAHDTRSASKSSMTSTLDSEWALSESRQ